MFDRFHLVQHHLVQHHVVQLHLVQHHNRAVDEVRRQVWRNLQGAKKAAFKRTRWLWLRNPWNLKREEKRRLSFLCQKDLPIVRAYYLKEAFQRFWDYKSAGCSDPYLRSWPWSGGTLAPRPS